jgi:hypothetical protein
VSAVLACAVWGAVLLILTVRAGIAPRIHSVYPIYERAGHAWLAGADLFEPAGEPFRYSPLAAALFAPISVLPTAVGGLLWRGVNVVAYLAALGWCSAVIWPTRLTGARRGTWFLLVLPLSLGSLSNGQSNVLVLALMLIAVSGVRQSRWNLASACLALACLFKAYPLALGLLLVAYHPRRLALRFGVALAAGLALPFLLQGPGYVLDQYRGWIGHLGANDRHLLLPHLWYRDLRLLGTVTGVDISYQHYQVIQLLAGGGMALFCLSGIRGAWSPRWSLSLVLGLSCCWMTVLGPATESATYILLAPVAAWLLVERRAAARFPGLRAVAGVAYALILASPIVDGLGGNRVLSLRGLQPLGALLILAHLLILGCPNVARALAATTHVLGARARRHRVAVAVTVWGLVTLVLMGYGFAYPRGHTVYDIYASAALHWWSGHDLYLFEREVYRYSPLFAIACSPFALLPEWLGSGLWKGLSCVFYALGLCAWARGVVPAHLSRSQTAILSLIALPVSLHSLYIGQANLLMVGCILFGLAAIPEGHWSRASAWLAAATLIKGYPIALALVLIALYPRRFTLRFIAAMALGLLLPFAAHWPATVAAQYVSWFHHLNDSTVIMRERVRTVEYLLQVYGHPITPRTFVLLEVVAGVAVLGLCLHGARRTASLQAQATWTYQLFACWVLLFGPATESCTYVVAAPAIAWALLGAFLNGTAWPVRAWLVACLLLMEPLQTDLFSASVRHFVNTHACQPIGALLFLTYVLTRMRLQHSAAVDEQALPVAPPESAAA